MIIPSLVSAANIETGVRSERVGDWVGLAKLCRPSTYRLGGKEGPVVEELLTKRFCTFRVARDFVENREAHIR